MSAPSTYAHTTGFEVAVIGMSGRFPGARNVREYWQNLRDGVESISFFSEDELLSAGVQREMLNRKDYVRAGALLENPEWFDAGFFGFSAREAEVMDPQHRILLECAYEALEDAGYAPESIGVRVGVYAGASMNTYIFNLAMNQRLVDSIGPLQILIGNDKDHLATRVSYKLNLRGPSFAVQTACSTSLVAVHLACRGLLSGECDMALAGGASVNGFRKAGYLCQEGSIFSPDGHCRAFDAKAAGTIPGNGVGLVVLKRLEDAIADGDSIHAVIKGSAIGNDGALKIGYTAPGVEGQTQAIRDALLMAEVDPSAIGYVEAHGTGTAIGDPIEIESLTEAYRVATDKKRFCAIGSVKTNIGHLDAAAGVAGLIKTILTVKEGLIPPSLHFHEPNPNIDFAETPFYVNDRLSDWKTDGAARLAAVSAFGLGGTNAHVILEEPPGVESAGESRPKQLIVLSARTESALDAKTSMLAAHLKRSSAVDLPDIAYTLNVGRRRFDRRRILVCSGPEDACAALESMDSTTTTTSKGSFNRAIVFMFPGQGSQYLNMGRELYGIEQSFREVIDFCADRLRGHLSIDLRDLMYTDELSDERALQLQQTSVAQPALFVIEYALARLWMEWGVQPRALIGHSVGEYVAACLADVFSLDDALRLISMRGRLMQQLPSSGKMLAVQLSPDELIALLDDNVSLAAINGPSACVVSGVTEHVTALEENLKRRGISSTGLRTSHAFHSAMMDPILESFKEAVSGVRLKRPAIPYISNVTGDWITPEQAMDADYWVTHLRQTVRYAEGIARLTRDWDSVFLEVGPGRALGNFARQQTGVEGRHLVLSSMPARSGLGSEEECILKTLGALWTGGATIDWPGFYTHERRRRVSLPTYPFERRRYWVEAATRPPAENGPENRIDSAPIEPEISHAAIDAPAPLTITVYPRPDLSSPYVAPASGTERKIVLIWQEFLGDIEIGIQDDFYELGGHSLMATQMANRLRDEFRIDLPLAEIFVASTIAELAPIVEQAASPIRGEAPVAGIQPASEREESCPLSFAQLRLWFFEQMSPGSALYNIPAAVRLEGPLNISALEQSIGEIARRHEALRTTFVNGEDEPAQIVHSVTALSLSIIEMSDFIKTVRDSETLRLAGEEAKRPFDLERGPLLSAALLRLDRTEHVLLLTMHHIVSDAYSLGVLTRELAALYSAYLDGTQSLLSELPIQYPDYSRRQRGLLHGEVLENHVAYWKKQLAGSPPLIGLPTDRPRLPVQSYQGAALPFELPPPLVEGLRQIGKMQKCTLFVTLLAAFNTLLHRQSGDDDIVIGADIAGRNRQELDGLIGFFVNMLAVRTNLSGNPTFLELLARVRQVAAEAYAHEDLPFDKLVERLEPERSLLHSPIFQVVFNYYQAPTDGLALRDLKLSQVNLDHEIARFDLSLFISDGAEKVEGYWRYRTGLFEAATIDRMHARFAALLQRIVEKPEVRLSALEIQTDAEKREKLKSTKRVKKSNLDKFKTTSPRSVDRGRTQLVKSRLFTGSSLPLLVEPEMPDVDLAAWAGENARFIETMLNEHGAILFRGFQPSIDGFEQFARALDPLLLSYTEPSSPRSVVRDKIYTSTEYPASQWILLHNEMSYSRQWPHKVFFHCVQPALQGGETPLAFSRRVFELLDSRLRERFIRHGVMYARNFGDGLDLSWQHVFNTSDRSEVERYCRRSSIEFEWQDGDRLKTRQVHQAVLKHPHTDVAVWFNQAHAFHVSSLEPSVRASLLAERREEDLPRNAYYGDGSRIEDSVIEEIREAYNTAAVKFDWQAGDILAVENMLVAHGRAPFVGARKVLVAMSGLVDGSGSISDKVA